MNKYELIKRLSSASENEVYIEIDGVLYEIDFGCTEPVFDGFTEFYPASITLKPID